MPTEPTFEEIHAPGSRILTASRWPCLILPAEQRPKWLCSPYELAAHMLGLRPMPEPGDEVHRGKRLEAVALQMMQEELDEELEGQTWVTHSWLEAGATLDGQTKARQPAETKVVDGRDFDRVWVTGPPLYPTLQMQCQIACTGADYGHVGALVLRHKTIEMHVFRVDRHTRIIKALELEADRFADMLDKETLPEPDASPSSYAALQDLVTVTKTTIQVPGSEAMERAAKWRQARFDRLAAEAEEAAQMHWFASRGHDAEILAMEDGKEIKRTQVSRKASTKKIPASSYWKWKV